MTDTTTYPASVIVHTPSGPEPCCTEHAQKLVNLMAFMGAHCFREPAEPGAQCNNCRNEAEKQP